MTAQTGSGAAAATVAGPDAGGAPIVEMRDVTRTFGRAPALVHALRGVSLTVRPGELLTVRGRSGSGKTTLLNLIAGLDRPDSGQVWVEGQEVSAMNREQALRLRRENVALVFQSFALLPMLSAAENVGLPMRLSRVRAADRERRARDLLALVGVEDRAQQRPAELSGGEQQRVAIARALANNARLLVADEPTGQLDSRSAAHIMTLLRTIVSQEGITAIVATHDRALTDAADRVIEIRSGQLA
ncbi:MAG TPA: ABC transporter ATP-binding protein [Streptosporangiaceae bacterium]|nr:ABC transporter ATP-binding protein [Streptosporangiaceae bacterium]